MRLFPVVGLLCLAASAIAGPRGPALADLAEQARSLPAEFAAEALLRLSGSSESTEAARKREWIEEAFRLASSAQQPFARRYWLGSRAGTFDKAYAQGMDTCTLQCRAVQAMLAVDRKKAREMFAEIPAPRLPRLTCDDPLVYDVSIFYATLTKVAAETFDPKEIAADEPLHLVQRYIADLVSPVQVAPSARMLAGASPKAGALDLLANSFAAALKQIPSDDRSFSASLSGDSNASAAIAELASACTLKQINPAPLLDAWRAYLVRNLSAARCADTASAESATASFGAFSRQAAAEVAYSGTPGAVRFFNEKMRTGEMRAISEDEVAPAKIEGKARAADQCDSGPCRDLSSQYRNLVLAPSGMPFTDAQKSGGEWGAKLREFLAAVAEWKSSDDSSNEFEWKSRFFMDVFNVAVSGPDRDAVLSAYLAWLSQNSYQIVHRVEWFYPVNAMILRAFGDARTMKSAIRELLSSKDPVISLYAQLEQLVPRPLNEAMRLQ